MDRDSQLGASLLLGDLNGAIADVLAPHPNNVATALRGAKQQRKRQTFPCADRMPRLKGGNVVLVPSAKAFGLARHILNAGGWVLLETAVADRELHERPHRLEP